MSSMHTLLVSPRMLSALRNVGWHCAALTGLPAHEALSYTHLPGETIWIQRVEAVC
jgi:hypothetical protein